MAAFGPDHPLVTGALLAAETNGTLSGTADNQQRQANREHDDHVTWHIRLLLGLLARYLGAERRDRSSPNGQDGKEMTCGSSELREAAIHGVNTSFGNKKTRRPYSLG
jgi:hypothetical protein